MPKLTDPRARYCHKPGHAELRWMGGGGGGFFFFVRVPVCVCLLGKCSQSLKFGGSLPSDSRIK